MLSRIFFSDFTCSIYLRRMISLFFKHFKATGSAEGGSLLCFTKRTRPKVPVPSVERNLKSFRRNLPWALRRSLAASSSSSTSISGPKGSGQNLGRKWIFSQILRISITYQLLRHWGPLLLSNDFQPFAFLLRKWPRVCALALPSVARE